MAALEFCLPPEHAGQLARMPFLGRQRARPANADRVWFDTADAALDRQGLSLCEQRGIWQLEVSRPRPGQPWVNAMPPLILAEAPDLEHLAHSSGHAIAAPLIPLAAFSGRRRVWTIAGPDEGELACTLTLIEGALRGVREERQVCRVVMDGPPDRLLALSSTVSASMRLTAPRCSLASEAAALARGQIPENRPKGLPAVLPGTSLTDAVATVLGHLTDVILTSAATAGDGHTTEPVHQMRVAVRRLRSALAVFRRAAGGPVFDDIDAQLKYFAAVLGRARDWDVFLHGTGAAVLAALPDDARVLSMLTAAARRRAVAYAELRSVLAGEVFRTMEIALVQATALRLWEVDADADQAALLQRDTKAYASRMLDHQLARMKATGNCISDMPVDVLHSIRKAGKRMRYACEFFAPLYGRRAALNSLPASRRCRRRWGISTI